MNRQKEKTTVKQKKLIFDASNSSEHNNINSYIF